MSPIGLAEGAGVRSPTSNRWPPIETVGPHPADRGCLRSRWGPRCSSRSVLGLPTCGSGGSRRRRRCGGAVVRARVDSGSLGTVWDLIVTVRDERSDVALVGENQYGVEDILMGLNCFVVPLVDGPNVGKVLLQTARLGSDRSVDPTCVGRKGEDAAVRVVERDAISIDDCPRAAIAPLHQPVDDTGGNGTSADHEGTSNITAVPLEPYENGPGTPCAGMMGL